jgi:hypothetical protein
MTKIAISKEQLIFLREITGIKEPQKAMDRVLEIMKEEGLPNTYILELLDRAMKNYPKDT